VGIFRRLNSLSLDGIGGVCPGVAWLRRGAGGEDKSTNSSVFLRRPVRPENGLRGIEIQIYKAQPGKRDKFAVAYLVQKHQNQCPQTA